MELSVREFQKQIAEAIAAVGRGERVIITRDGQAVAELCPSQASAPHATEADISAFRARVELARQGAGMSGQQITPPLDEAWRQQFDNPAWGRTLMGLDPDDGDAVGR